MRDELVVVLNLYHKLNFGQFDQRQPVVIAMAKQLERTPSSVAMKLSNFASLDPALKLRGIKGLEGASRLDRQIWAELQESTSEFLVESEQVLRDLFEADENEVVVVEHTKGIRRQPRSVEDTETTANVKQRRGQEFFRDAVLNNFEVKCGVTGMPVRELLVASHILPWSRYPDERLNVSNGLCLARTHDVAFDRGLITFDSSLRLQLSNRLKQLLDKRAVEESFGKFEGTQLKVPKDAILPNEDFLAIHRTECFQKS